MWLYFALIVSALFFLFSSNDFLFSNILNNIKSWKISWTQLEKMSKQIPDSTKIIWPVEKVVDLSYKTLNKYHFTYEKYKHTNWKDIPEGMKRDFPLHINDYINKYKFITLKTCWNYFSDPEKLNYFTFMRRVVRTIWTASYDWDKIWIRWSWTHAGVDIVSAKWTPIYSISTGLVVEVYYSNKWFWDHIAVLYKINWKFYVVYYAHLSKILVSVWNIVWKWQKIALMWSSWNSTTPHLHFQVNRVFTLQDIVSWRIWIWWYKNINGVKAYTVDPILLVEQNLDNNFYKYKNWDNFPIIKKEKVLKKENTNHIEKKQVVNWDDIVKALVNNLQKKVESKKEEKQKKTKEVKKSYIKNVSLSLLDNKIQVWHGFTIKLVVATWVWNIVIKPSNANLSYSPDIISNPDKTTYIINVLALKEWVTHLTISDSKSVRDYKITIYKPDDWKQLFWFKTDVSKLNLLLPTKIDIYPINKFWQKLNIPIKWVFKISFEKNWKIYLIKTVQTDWKLVLFLTGKFLGRSKLVVEWNKVVYRKNIITNISKDYPYNGLYADHIKALINLGIVKWDNWYLLPNNLLSRRALLILIWRSILKVNYGQAKKEMLSYLKKKWKFFKDIDGSSYADPYIFIAWKKWIVKWENGYSLANTYVTKWELLTILTRVFKIKIKNNPFNVWTDLKSWQLKAVADTVKQYNLYPFKNLNTFNAGSYVSRLVAFETLYRFINFNPNVIHASAETINISSVNQWLEKTMKSLLDF